MAPGSGPARWNPQSQQWERQEDPQRRSRRGRPESGAGRGEPGPERPKLPPKPSYPPGTEPPDPEDAYASEDAPADAPPARRTGRRWRLGLGIAIGVAVVAGGAALAAPYLMADSTALPDGYKVLRSAGAGFQVAVPKDWQLSTSESGSAAGTVFRPEQGSDSLLQVFRVTGGPDNPCEVLVEGTKELSSREGYRRISLEAVDTTGCEIVYEVPGGGTNGTVHAIGRLAVASGGSRWVLMGFGPATEPKAVRARMAAALGSFRPD
ncbi:hypothetical protein [Streptomyces sp. NRRL S-244]|uniref:hypothetical protein n=1 Tax=Streptomyces sp. NRRL S-244 TaxID=1463897 RepID=UPI0004BE56C4|nr:hypothetical protein [Streptomyces sp. NRRL S-244]